MPDSDQGRRIREWVQAYRAWNEQEIARRRAAAGRQTVEEKLAAFFDLCEEVQQLAGPKSLALYQAHLRARAVVQERIARFEKGRADGKPSA